jgi:hypothetical protein
MSSFENQNHPLFDAGKLGRVCLVALCAGGLLGTIGPFGTFQTLDVVARYGFWIGAIFVGMIIHVPIFYAASWIGRERKLPAWMWVSLSAIVAAFPMTFVINGIFASMFAANDLRDLPQLYILVLAISLPMQFLAFATAEGFKPKAPIPQITPTPMPIATPAPSASPDATDLKEAPVAALPLIWKRVPARLGRDLICLEMEDHYLRVHTKLGDGLIHLRMTDAVQELEGLEGMLVHRSFWVARHAITGWQRDGKTLLLHLSNGKSVPVARDRQPLVKAAGWLE